MKDIEHCDQCESYFLSRPLMQAEVIHEGVHGGESAARSLMLELMEPIHEQHAVLSVGDERRQLREMGYEGDG